VSETSFKTPDFVGTSRTMFGLFSVGEEDSGFCDGSDDGAAAEAGFRPIKSFFRESKFSFIKEG